MSAMSLLFLLSRPSRQSSRIYKPSQVPRCQIPTSPASSTDKKSQNLKVQNGSDILLTLMSKEQAVDTRLWSVRARPHDVREIVTPFQKNGFASVTHHPICKNGLFTLVHAFPSSTNEWLTVRQAN